MKPRKRTESVAAPRRYRAPSSSALLRHVLERPELVASVRKLPGAALAELVDRVGLEDAGELVALATTEQLEQVFDRDLWRAPSAGADEVFQPQRFASWLEILAEAGDDFVAERLHALPRDLLVLAVHRLVLVLDLDALALELSESGDASDPLEKALEGAPHEEWEEFRLLTRDPSSWDVVWSSLLALDRNHHALLRAVLEQCAALDAEVIEDAGGLYEVLTSDAMLENDVAAARSDRRGAEGYVAPADARAFLALGPLGDGRLERDPITHAHFRDLTPVRSAADGGGPRAPEPPDEHVATLLALLADPVGPSPTGGAPTRHLDAGDERGPGRRGTTATTLAPGTALGGRLERALRELRPVRPDVVDQRFEELAYLANVLIAGSSQHGRTPRPIEALELAVRACNAGLARARRHPHLTDEPSAKTAARAGAATTLSADAELLTRLPADVLFRLGRDEVDAPMLTTKGPPRRR